MPLSCSSCTPKRLVPVSGGLGGTGALTAAHRATLDLLVFVCCVCQQGDMFLRACSVCLTSFSANSCSSMS